MKTSRIGLTLVVSLIFAGLAGIVYGAKRVLVEAEGPSLVPTVKIGPRSGSLTWHF